MNVIVAKCCDNSNVPVNNDYIFEYYDFDNLISDNSKKDITNLDRGMTKINLASEMANKKLSSKGEDGMDGQKDDGGRGRKVVRQRAYLVKGEEGIRGLLDSGANITMSQFGRQLAEKYNRSIVQREGTMRIQFGKEGAVSEAEGYADFGTLLGKIDIVKDAQETLIQVAQFTDQGYKVVLVKIDLR